MYGLCPDSIPDEIATKGNSSWELSVTSPLLKLENDRKKTVL